MKLVIFADYGLDDACATAYLLARREKWSEIDIVPVGGNVAAARALANAKKLLAAAQTDGCSLSGIRLVDTTAVQQPSCPLPSIHGKDGMGDLFEDIEVAPVPVLPYETWRTGITCPYEVLSLGPCTVVAHFLANAPVLPHGDLVIMGGNNGEEPNYNGYEFNDGLDHAAFVAVLAYPHVCATLDTCRVPAFNDIARTYAHTSLFDTLMRTSVALAFARHPDRCYVYDRVAAEALVHPDRFAVREVPYYGAVMRELSYRAARPNAR